MCIRDSSISGTNYDLKTYFKITDDIGEHHTDGKVYFAGGGGGGSWAVSIGGGSGGLGGGGNGGGGSSGNTDTTQQGENGSINSGGGGGGGGDWTPIGGKGGSGIVIIRYRKYKEIVNNLNIATGAGATPDIIIPHILNSTGGNYYKYKNIVYSGGGGSIIEQGKDGEINQYGIGGKGLFYNITSINTEYGRGGDGSYIKTEIEYDITDGLIAHYKFDGNSHDSSGNNHNLISIGTIEYDESTYIYGKSSYLSGDDHFQTPSSLNPYNIWNGNGITISGWFKLKSTSSDWGTLFEIYQDGDNRISVAKSSNTCLLYTSPSPRDRQKSRMPSSA